jgi:hypothetical protein
MKLKTLLLSSAATFMVVGAAQAADLSVAEPVDYVKVCDAFGAGYWYIPGTDTCLKIGGLVQVDIQFHSTAGEDLASSVRYDMQGGFSTAAHSASWNMQTEAHLDATVKSMTEYGPLTGFLSLRGVSDNASGTNNVVTAGATGIADSGTYFAYLDHAYLELGMLFVGRDASIYDYSGGFNYDWKDLDADTGTDQIHLTWAMSGFGIQLGIEDPRDRWGTNLSMTYSMPDIVGNITLSQGHWSAKLSGGFAETTWGSGFGAQLATTIKLDSIAPGDQLMLKTAWAENKVFRFAAGTKGGIAGASSGSVWSAAASFQHFWAPTLSSAVTWQYFNQTGGGIAKNTYSIVGNLVWAPVTGFSAGVEAGYQKTNTASSGSWGVKIRLVRSW